MSIQSIVLSLFLILLVLSRNNKLFKLVSKKVLLSSILIISFFLFFSLNTDAMKPRVNTCSKNNTQHEVKTWSHMFSSNPIYELCISDIGYPVFKYPNLAFYGVQFQNPFGLFEMMSYIKLPLIRSTVDDFSHYFMASSYPTTSLLIEYQIDQIKWVLEFYENCFETNPPYS